LTVSPTSTKTLSTRPAVVGPDQVSAAGFDGANAEQGRGQFALCYRVDRNLRRRQWAGAEDDEGEGEQQAKRQHNEPEAAATEDSKVHRVPRIALR
jgi:hypothetical protein